MHAPQTTTPSTTQGATRPVAAALALLAGLASCVVWPMATVWMGPVSLFLAPVAGGVGAAAVYWHFRKNAPRPGPPTPRRAIGGGLRVWGLMTVSGAGLGAFVGMFVLRESRNGASLAEAVIYGAELSAPVGAALGFVLGALTVAILALFFPTAPSDASSSVQ